MTDSTPPNPSAQPDPSTSVGGELSFGAPWEREELPGRFTVEETAQRVGHYRWFEMSLFEVLGGWVGRSPELEVKHRFGVHCYHHAFHAELWYRRLPELRSMDPERLSVAPNEEMASVVDLLGSMAVPELTIERMVAFYRVILPHLISTYTFHRSFAATVTDGPTIRALDLCLADDLKEWQEGEMLLQHALRSTEALERAAAQQVQLAELLVEAGGVCGPGSAG